MIGTVLNFYKNELTSYLNQIDAVNKEINFPSYNDTESINFKDESLNLMLIKLEEENVLRQSELHANVINGETYSVFPEIRLNLYLLFVANFNNYIVSLDMLSLVIKYFQAKRIFNQSNSPDLSDEIEKLTIELVTVPFGQQDEIWNALRTSYRPSALYKIRMIVYQQEPEIATSMITEIQPKFKQK